jgi:hypothetical protein
MRPLLVVATLLFAAPSADAGQRRCVSAYGVTACGYQCTADYGEVRCARTPAGACLAEYGQVQCWDPPRYWRGMPAAQCTAAYGTIACGYDCVAAYGEVRCAHTPDGVCEAAYGAIQCSEGY